MKQIRPTRTYSLYAVGFVNVTVHRVRVTSGGCAASVVVSGSGAEKHETSDGSRERGI